MMLRRIMCGVGKKQIHDMSLNSEPSTALQRTNRACRLLVAIEIQNYGSKIF